MTEAKSRHAFIAGGAGGMGVAIARKLALGGDKITIADLPGPRLDAVAHVLAEIGAPYHIVELDIRSVARCREAVSAAAGWGGGIDILVNAAGVWLEGPSEEVEEQGWDRVFDVNLKGAFFVTSAALPHLVRSRGAVVNIASDAGLVGNNGAAVYCASKGGLVLLTKALALEYAPQGVRFNAVCPADVATPMLDQQAEVYGGDDPEGYRKKLLAHYPQGDSARFIRTEEVARLVQYLCEPDAAPMTGTAIPLDFGVTAGY
ncbi:SDR family oxidoreductase [Agrobacterium tumefaciens]|uniref:SDR family NAD(P)-dependent oxidoreductase n=1 Tax=Agrobacterium tumefaciens TaxID=358 RepID=UPI00157211CD|nr:SDR family oxidoreductase [Agrobacterium tumefaciens]NTE65527.1 SDR family oxidoreductase [Agrobacterium tumefaciens]